jgi:hypothetical protein
MSAYIYTTPEYCELFWNSVVGPQHSPQKAVVEFDLSPGDLRGFEEWLGEAQVEAERQGAVWPDDMDVGGCLGKAAQSLRDAADEMAAEAGAESAEAAVDQLVTDGTTRLDALRRLARQEGQWDGEVPGTRLSDQSAWRKACLAAEQKEILRLLAQEEEDAADAQEDAVAP